MTKRHCKSNSCCLLFVCTPLTFSLHVVHWVSNNFICVELRPVPRQKDRGARHGVSSYIPGSTGPIFRHHHDEPGHGEDRPLLVLCLALIDGIVLRDDLVDDQFAMRHRHTQIKIMHTWSYPEACLAVRYHSIITFNKHWQLNNYTMLNPFSLM